MGIVSLGRGQRSSVTRYGPGAKLPCKWLPRIHLVEQRAMTTANKITVARILMIPVFVTLAIYYGESIQRGAPLEWQRFAAIFVFLLAAASDGLDGYIARRYNQRSALGVILDPIADKGLLLSGIITLSITNWSQSDPDYGKFPVWFPVLVITRDAVILVGAAILHY